MSLKTVLVVEDNPGDIRLLKKALESFEKDHILRVAGSGEEALKELQKNPNDPPAFILLDQNLPGLSGTEVLHKIRKTGNLQDVKIAMFSSAEKPHFHAENTPDKYLVKPLHFDHYKAVVVALFDEWLP